MPHNEFWPITEAWTLLSGLSNCILFHADYALALSGKKNKAMAWVLRESGSALQRSAEHTILCEGASFSYYLNKASDAVFLEFFSGIYLQAFISHIYPKKLWLHWNSFSVEEVKSEFYMHLDPSSQTNFKMPSAWKQSGRKWLVMAHATCGSPWKFNTTKLVCSGGFLLTSTDHDLQCHSNVKLPESFLNVWSQFLYFWSWTSSSSLTNTSPQTDLV